MCWWICCCCSPAVKHAQTMQLDPPDQGNEPPGDTDNPTECRMRKKWLTRIWSEDITSGVSGSWACSFCLSRVLFRLSFYLVIIFAGSAVIGHNAAPSLHFRNASIVPFQDNIHRSDATSISMRCLFWSCVPCSGSEMTKQGPGRKVWYSIAALGRSCALRLD